ncbi:DUF2500 domain-containing protein, partial [Dysosmobacter welbionis]
GARTRRDRPAGPGVQQLDGPPPDYGERPPPLCVRRLPRAENAPGGHPAADGLHPPDGEHRPGDGPGICHRHRAGGGAPLPYHRGSAPPDPAGQQRAGAAGGSGRAAGAGAGDADDEPGGPGEGNGTDLSGGGD